MNTIIIDDHPLAIAVVRDLLIEDDIEILAGSAEGGSAAQRVEILKSDIVIIDVDISGIDGIRALETLRERQYSGIITIVSAKNDHFYGKHCADADANGLVSKKEGMNNIAAVIETVRNGCRYFPFFFNRFVGSLASDQQKLDSPSKQKISIMRYILDGKGNSDTAERVFISNKIVSTYRSRLMEELECKSLMDLHAFVRRNKIS